MVALRCLLGHKWSLWEYVASDSCEQERTCSRCGATEKRDGVYHKWVWRYKQPGSCEQEQVCSRCGKPGFRDPIFKGPAIIGYKVKKKHERIEDGTCVRCGEKPAWAAFEGSGDGLEEHGPTGVHQFLPTHAEDRCACGAQLGTEAAEKPCPYH
jgi:ribosomal protein S27AE